METSGKMSVEAQEAQQMGDRLGELSENLLKSISIFKLPDQIGSPETPLVLATKA